MEKWGEKIDIEWCQKLIESVPEEKNEKSIPVYELPFGDIGMDSGEESEEEVLCDGDRDEDDIHSDYKFLLNENTKTFTRVKLPIKVYYRSCSCSESVLHDEEYPVPTVTKLALDRYNAIEGTNYEYVGLIKAYGAYVGGFSYTVRFKACLPAQHPIYFQAMLWQETPDRDTHHILVNVPFVHPLPDS
ncbi:hypothetical protein POM88_042420 [Heracleum sosnowskyi]|uniref:Cystatin domain-containing protein n=1 Tax=Heracleum sosnowskyi TaxID=360622 RepID=A0AAD8MBM0_9APIA|nr:hypothetical protein POM88_042420 [Heracleum sosnowskyi]